MLNKAQQSINGLQMGGGGSTSIGGVCIIWDDFEEQLRGIIDGFRREVENLKNDIERVPYNEAKELQKLNQEERQLKKAIEENQRKAEKETDPNKKNALIFLIESDKAKWKKVLERKKQLKSNHLGDSFSPNDYVNDFLEELKNKLSGQGKPSRTPRQHIHLPSDPSKLGNSNLPNDPLDPFRSRQSNISQNLPLNSTSLILIGIVLLALLYFFSQSEPTPTRKPNFYDYDF